MPRLPPMAQHRGRIRSKSGNSNAANPNGQNPNGLFVETRTPLRLGKPLPLIPFVFHGPKHSLPKVDKLPLADVIAINLDHYRLNADYKHGMHFTALPTAWVSGFDKTSNLRIGSSTAWVSETPGATAGYPGISRSRSDDFRAGDDAR